MPGYGPIPATVEEVREHIPEIEAADLSLAQRMPGYLLAFATGLGITVAVGVGIGAASDAAVGEAAAYTVILYGVLLLLLGGGAGGGYANLGLGAVEALVGGRNRVGEDTADPDVRRGRQPTRDPMERLRRGLRPEANPDAFWKVIGGFAYVAIGLGILTWLA